MRYLAVLAAAAVAAAPTTLHHWSATRAHVVQRAAGSCFAASIADPRADAWRCFRGNEIHDPCFATGKTSAVCPLGTPDSRDALLLRLTKPLPRGETNPAGDPTRKPPWAIVTAAGLYCYRATGTLSVHAGRTLTYYCAGSALLAGSPDRSRSTWTIRMLPTAAAKRFVTTRIAEAWW